MELMLTNRGEELAGNGFLTGVFPKITKVKFGDGNGSMVIPSKDMTNLVNPIQDGIGTTVSRLGNPNRLYIYTQIPTTVGGITLREVGLFSEYNELIAIGGNFEKVKPLASESVERFEVYMTLLLTTTQDITVGFSNDNLYAPQGAIDVLQAGVENNRQDLIEVNNTLPTKINYLDIIDNLTDLSTNKPLSANQGKILKTLIDNINTVLLSDNTTLDSMQELVDFIEMNRETLNTLGISSIAGLQNALNSKLDVNGKAVDSDKLDGIDSSEFMRKSQDNTISSNLIFNNGGTDTNGFTFKANGTYQNINIDMLNGVLRFFRDNGLQVFYIGTDNNIHANNGTNGDGIVWTSAIDGSGSGLDADLLDGIQATSFARKDLTALQSFLGNIEIGNSGALTTDGGRIFLKMPTNMNVSSSAYIDIVNNSGVPEFRLIYKDAGGANHIFSLGRGGGEVFHSGFMGQGSGLVADSVRGYVPENFFKINNPNETNQKITIIVNTSSTDGSQYAAGAMELRTTNGSNPTLGFHRSGYSAVALYESAGDLYTKNNNNNAGKVWTAVNDGSGSGLDADLLDGKHASDLISLSRDPAGINIPFIKLEADDTIKLGQYNGEWLRTLHLTSNVDDLNYKSTRILLDKGTTLASNGMEAKNNGVIEKWGNGGTAALTETILYPVAFPTTTTSVIPVLVGDTAGSVTVVSKDRFGFTIKKSLGFGISYRAIGY